MVVGTITFSEAIIGTLPVWTVALAVVSAMAGLVALRRSSAKKRMALHPVSRTKVDQ
jgi:hypothetical protein